MLFDAPSVTVADFEARSGWHVEPEGLCRDDVCIPLAGEAWRGDEIDLTLISRTLDMPLVNDAEEGVWAIGPRAAERALRSAAAPELVLPDVKGQPFNLASLCGKKVLLLAWASW